MWTLSKTVTIAGAHHLNNYDGMCKNIHGHNWVVTVYCKGEHLDSAGMLIDFNQIKNIVNQYDHKYFNDCEAFKDVNPTAENIAFLLCNKIPFCYKVDVVEAPGSICSYEK